MRNSTVKKEFAKRMSDILQERFFGNVSMFARTIDVTPTSINRWINEGSEPSLTLLVNIAERLNVDVHWLMTGENTSIKTQTVADADADKYAYIPYFPNIVASAGGGRLNDEGQAREHLAFRKDWIESSALNANNLVAIKATGDSMVPTIPENTTILIDKSKDNAVDGRIYVVRVDEQLFIKRVQRLPTGGIRLISDNAIYAPMDLSKADLEQSDIKVYGQVVHLSYLLPH